MEAGMAAGRRIGLAAALAALGLALFAGQASAAGNVTVQFGILHISGDAGANDIAVGIDPTDPAQFRIADSTGISDPLPPGCVRVSATAVRCPIASVTVGISVLLNDGDDQFKVSSGDLPAGTPLRVEGGLGNDTIRGSAREGGDLLYGDEGNDTIFGEGGADLIRGGIGDDELLGGPGKDDIQGEEGNDFLSGEGGDDKLDGGKGKDVINGLSDDDKLLGGKGNDALSGGSGNDNGNGGAGKDSFNGGGGTDKGKAEKLKNVEK
jgi:Ca2+-binding RTX toxin-like protein